MAQLSDAEEVALYSSKANTMAKDHDFNGAIALLSKAINIEPNAHSLYSNRSMCYQQLGVYGLALEDAQHASRLEPTRGKYYYREGLALLKLKRFREAERAFNNALLRGHDPALVKEKLFQTMVAFAKELGIGSSEAMSISKKYMTCAQLTDAFISGNVKLDYDNNGNGDENVSLSNCFKHDNASSHVTTEVDEEIYNSDDENGDGDLSNNMSSLIVNDHNDNDESVELSASETKSVENNSFAMCSRVIKSESPYDQSNVKVSFSAPMSSSASSDDNEPAFRKPSSLSKPIPANITKFQQKYSLNILNNSDEDSDEWNLAPQLNLGTNDNKTGNGIPQLVSVINRQKPIPEMVSSSKPKTNESEKLMEKRQIDDRQIGNRGFESRNSAHESETESKNKSKVSTYSPPKGSVVNTKRPLIFRRLETSNN